MAKSKVLVHSEFLLAMAFLAVFNLMPEKLGRAVGRLLGIISYYLLAQGRRISMINLDIVYGSSKTVEEKRKIARNSFINMGETIFEFVKFQSFSDQYFRNHTRCVNREVLDEAMSMNKGVIVCSAHYSNWEWVAAYFGMNGIKVNAVVRPLDNALLDRKIEAQRAEKGIHVIPRNRAVREGIELLEKGENMALMIDQNQAAGGVFVPLFGVKASTMKGPVFFHRKTGSPVLIAVDRRHENGHHEIIFSDLIPMDGSDEECLGRINKWLEKMILEKPELNFWVHPRWKKRPEGESSVYSNRKSEYR